MEHCAAQLDTFENLLTQQVLDVAWRYCYRLCRQREDAEDLLQDALAHGYNRIGQLKDPSAFKSWLMCIVRSQFLMNLRRRKVENLVHANSDEAILHIVDTSTAGETNLEALEITAALEQLPAGQREILELFYLDELNLAETAQVLGLSQGAVQQRLFRARGALRRAVDRVRLHEQPRAYASQ